MQSPKQHQQYHKHKEEKLEDESPLTTAEEEVIKQTDEIIDPTVSQSAALKGKKHVHYRQPNGGHSILDGVKTDNLKQNHDNSSGSRIIY